jgi:polysaccharide biosynthesis transport protein
MTNKMLPGTSENKTAEPDVSYGHLVSILLRQRFWFLGTFSFIFALSTVIALMRPTIYKSSMQLLIESNYKAKEDQASTRPEDQFADSNLKLDNATQLNLMRSTKLLGRAANSLQSKYPDISAQEIKKSLTLTQVVEESKGGDKVNTKIFEVTYAGNDPQKTKDVVRAIQEVYQQYNLEQQKSRLAQGIAFIDEQLPQIRSQLSRASKNLEKFRRGNGLVSPDLQSQSLVQASNAIEQEQRTNRAQIQELEGRYSALQGQLARSPKDALVAARLSQSLRYQTLLGEIQKIDLQLAQQSLRFNSGAPPLQRLKEQRQGLLSLLKKEQGRVLLGNSAKSSGESLLKQGQFGAGDVGLTDKLVEAQTTLSALQARAKSLQTTKQQVGGELKRLPGLLAEYDRLLPEVNVNRSKLEQLLRAKQELSLEISRGGFAWQVVEEPQLGLRTSNRVTDLLIGGVVGLMLGTLVAFIRNALDKVIHTTDELESQSNLPFLGALPAVPYKMLLATTQILALPSPASPNEPVAKSLPLSGTKMLLSEVGRVIGNLPQYKLPTEASSVDQLIHWRPFKESLDVLIKTIQFCSDTSIKSLVITSALPGEGKSTLALGLAMRAANLHKRVLLIDADLRCPSLHKQLNLPNRRGLSTLLGEAGPLQDQSILQEVGGISVLTSGPLPAEPASLLSSPRMGKLLEAFEQAYDLVVFDVPPALEMVDASLISSICDGVVLIGRIDYATRAEHKEAANLLRKFNVIGVVANGVTLSHKRYETYSSYYSEKSRKS